MKKTIIALFVGLTTIPVQALERISIGKSGNWEAYAFQDEFTEEKSQYGLLNRSLTKDGSIEYIGFLNCDGEKKGIFSIASYSSETRRRYPTAVRKNTNVEGLAKTDTGLMFKFTGKANNLGNAQFDYSNTKVIINSIKNEDANTVRYRFTLDTNTDVLNTQNIKMGVQGLNNVLKISQPCNELFL